jgi:protein TonB
MSYAEQHDPGKRLAGLVIVMAFHVVLIYALVEGLARKIVEVALSPLETKILEEVKPPPDKPPPPPPPRLVAPPPPFIPMPDVQLQLAPTGPTISAVTRVKPEAPVPPPARPAPVKAHVPVRVAAVVKAESCEKPAYPAASIRANETGIVLLNFLIDVDGTVLESKIDRTSGHRRLDEAARSGLAYCKFKPSTLDGKPERTWARIEYEWKLD